MQTGAFGKGESRGVEQNESRCLREVLCLGLTHSTGSSLRVLKSPMTSWDLVMGVGAGKAWETEWHLDWCLDREGPAKRAPRQGRKERSVAAAGNKGCRG